MRHPVRHGAKYLSFAAGGLALFYLLAHGVTPQRKPAQTDDGSIIVLERHLARPVWRDFIRRDDVKFLAVVTFLTASPGSLQTFNVPANWNNANNKIETIAGAASGGAVFNIGGGAVTGGGAGAYSAQPNVTLTPGGTAQYQIGVGGTAVTASVSGTSSAGNNGGDTWFNGATLAASSCGAKAGLAGTTSAGTAINGGAGGAAASGVGTTKSGGGRGGNITAAVVIAATGGGGAAGPNGAGNNGGDTATNVATGGGSGDAGSGGSAGAGGGSGTNGGNGTEFDATHGSGGGGGGGVNSTANNGGNGGNYGAAGGGAIATQGAATSGAGIQGLIVVTNFPLVLAAQGYIIGL